MGRTIRQFITHVINIIDAKGGKRIFYAIINILIMALSIFFSILVYKMYSSSSETLSSSGFIAWILLWVGIFCCAVIALVCFVEGFIAQIVALVCTGIGMFKSEQKGANIAAFIICIISIAAAVYAAVYLLG